MCLKSNELHRQAKVVYDGWQEVWAVFADFELQNSPKPK
jgi:hypothetical protein